MAEKKLANVFAQFQGHETKTAVIKAFGDAEVKYRTLTRKESEDFQKRLVKGFDSEGKPEFDFDNMSIVRNEKVALGLIEPAITVTELENLSDEASEGIAEIEALISGTKDTTDEEGN